MRAFIIALLLWPFVAQSEPINFFCKYTSYSDIKGNHTIENTFDLNFLIDEDTKKSYMLGNNGSSKVINFTSEGQISFIEVTETKNVMSTAIDSNLNSVHSRNTIILGKLIAAQYYGKCEVK
jgi:hypothetical protein